jgi:hypothetical protein
MKDGRVRWRQSVRNEGSGNGITEGQSRRECGSKKEEGEGRGGGGVGREQ